MHVPSGIDRAVPSRTLLRRLPGCAPARLSRRAASERRRRRGPGWPPGGDGDRSRAGAQRRGNQTRATTPAIPGHRARPRRRGRGARCRRSAACGHQRSRTRVSRERPALRRVPGRAGSRRAQERRFCLDFQEPRAHPDGRRSGRGHGRDKDCVGEKARRRVPYMTWVDAIPFVFIIGYGVLGYFTGLIRRIISLIALYIAFVAATNMGLQAGGILQQTSSTSTPDARIYGFFGIVFIVMIVLDGAGQLAHSQIQLEAIVFNRVSGAVVGVLTGLILSVLLVYELQAAANPFGGSQLDGLQQNIRDGVNGSRIAVPLTRAIERPIVAIFQPVLPADPQIYFGPGPVNP